jgi:hypothetical protein
MLNTESSVEVAALEFQRRAHRQYESSSTLSAASRSTSALDSISAISSNRVVAWCKSLIVSGRVGLLFAGDPAHGGG